MTTSADTGDGAIFRIAATSAGPFTTIGECKVVGLPEETRDAVEATHLGSGGNREYIPGVADGGEFSLEFNFVAAGYGSLRTKHTAGAAFYVEGEEPNGDVWGGTVVLTNLKAGDLSVGEVITGSATFKVSGALAYEAA